MIIPEIAIEMSKRFEGFHHVPQNTVPPMASPYLCPAGFWTIGWGTLCAKDHPPISLETGEAYLLTALESSARQAVALCPGLLHADERRLAAIIDFTYNLGAGRLKASTLRKRILAADWPGAAVEIRKWVWGGGKKLPGLIIRREEEARMLIG